jgi:hypothetical protein
MEIILDSKERTIAQVWDNESKNAQGQIITKAPILRSLRKAGITSIDQLVDERGTTMHPLKALKGMYRKLKLTNFQYADLATATEKQRKKGSEYHTLPGSEKNDIQQYTNVTERFEETTAEKGVLVIEKIVDEQVDMLTEMKEYRIRWKGRTRDEDTWLRTRIHGASERWCGGEGVGSKKEKRERKARRRRRGTGQKRK